jgi:hypothetical protein
MDAADKDRHGMTTINLKLVEISLDRVTGDDFEKFAVAFLPEILGTDLVPTGGVHDGGADGFIDTGLYCGRRVGAFYQASVQDNYKAKIRHTIKRLREFGRDPKSLLYVTSRPINTPDADDEELSAELDVVIKIRPRAWILGNVQRSPATIEAYTTYLAPHIAFINDFGAASLIAKSPHVPSRSVCVFLSQEVERRRKNSKLLESLVDSLILWSLDKTDPDKGLFLTRDEILLKIETAFVPAKNFIRGVIDNRLIALASKENTNGREIRWYAREKKACLPFETREIIREENIEDEFLITTVLEQFETRANSMLPVHTESDVTGAQAARVAISAIHQAFVNNGLDLAAFLKEGGSSGSCPPLTDDIDFALESAETKSSDRPILKAVALGLLRGAFYESSPEQREYLGKLARTYSLVFSLQADPRTVEYFQHMSANFVLLVGTDILIRALSERYLKPSDQMTCNLLKILQQAGATLYISDPVVDEVHRHLETTDWEFRNYCARSEPYIDENIARHIGKILIRAYFYAKLKPAEGVQPPGGWRSFIGQFCSYDSLHRPAVSKNELRQYLVNRFGMSVLATEDMERLVNSDELEELTEQLKPYKSEQGAEILARSDAKMILAVYGLRRERREEFSGSAYGFNTWWLTHETLVQRATADWSGERDQSTFSGRTLF